MGVDVERILGNGLVVPVVLRLEQRIQNLSDNVQARGRVWPDPPKMMTGIQELLYGGWTDANIRKLTKMLGTNSSMIDCWGMDLALGKTPRGFSDFNSFQLTMLIAMYKISTNADDKQFYNEEIVTLMETKARSMDY